MMLNATVTANEGNVRDANGRITKIEKLIYVCQWLCVVTLALFVALLVWTIFGIKLVEGLGPKVSQISSWLSLCWSKSNSPDASMEAGRTARNPIECTNREDDATRHNGFPPSDDNSQMTSEQGPHRKGLNSSKTMTMQV